MYEMNYQRTPASQWQTREYETEREAREAAEYWAQYCYNCNYQGTRPGPDNQPGWTMRNGRPR